MSRLEDAKTRLDEAEKAVREVADHVLKATNEIAAAKARLAELDRQRTRGVVGMSATEAMQLLAAYEDARAGVARAEKALAATAELQALFASAAEQAREQHREAARVYARPAAEDAKARMLATLDRFAAELSDCIELCDAAGLATTGVTWSQPLHDVLARRYVGPTFSRLRGN